MDAYRQLVETVTKAFSNIRHEIHEMVAEGDRVAMVMTLHMTHTGEYEGIAATGRTVRVPEMAVMHVRDGKIASERVLVDPAGLHTQLTAASPAS